MGRTVSAARLAPTQVTFPSTRDSARRHMANSPSPPAPGQAPPHHHRADNAPPRPKSGSCTLQCPRESSRLSLRERTIKTHVCLCRRSGSISDPRCCITCCGLHERTEQPDRFLLFSSRHQACPAFACREARRYIVTEAFSWGVLHQSTRQRRRGKERHGGAAQHARAGLNAPRNVPSARRRPASPSSSPPASSITARAIIPSIRTLIHPTPHPTPRRPDPLLHNQPPLQRLPVRGAHRPVPSPLSASPRPSARALPPGAAGPHMGRLRGRHPTIARCERRRRDGRLGRRAGGLAAGERAGGCECGAGRGGG